MTDPAKLAASALAAYTSSPGIQQHQHQQQQHHHDAVAAAQAAAAANAYAAQYAAAVAPQAASAPDANILATVYQNQAIEALRRQEELRLMEAARALQRQQLSAAQPPPPDYGLSAMSAAAAAVATQYSDAEEEEEDEDEDEEEEEEEEDVDSHPLQQPQQLVHHLHHHHHHHHHQMGDQYGDADEDDDDDEVEEELEEEEEESEEESDGDMAQMAHLPPAIARELAASRQHPSIIPSAPQSMQPMPQTSSPEPPPLKIGIPPAGGKPEALATAIAQASIPHHHHEQEEDQEDETQQEDEMEQDTGVALAEPAVEQQEEPDSPVATVIKAEIAPPSPKQSPPAAKPPPKKKKATPKKAKAPTTTRKSSKANAASANSGPTLNDPVPDITEEEYKSVESLMTQFCQVPLLAEFSRPVSLLHPELMNVYSKVVKHPIDLAKVCRGIRRRTYKDTRAIKMDMWRIFANCIKYHSHPSNKDSVPAFISIALHLREYFNALWQEHMMPSDPPPAVRGSANIPKGSFAFHLKAAFEKRDKDRRSRIGAICTTMLSSKCLMRINRAIQRFQDAGGQVDRLDQNIIFGPEIEDEDGEMEVFLEALDRFKARLKELSENEEAEYTIEDLDKNMNALFTDIFPSRPTLRVTVTNRLNRLIGKILVPIYELGCRGVNQSSIWGCMAAAIWARESTKKPFWPALVLGIMAPEEQQEDWHQALTLRNEVRLPEKLRNELQAGKRRAEQALKRQAALGAHEQMSQFLVEFMGTHEFIWVRESDIIESFDPEDDPNQNNTHGNLTKKKRRIADSKPFQSALEEGRWALEEFELQLSDSCGDLADEEEGNEEQEMNYSYSVLCQSDDELSDDEEREFTLSDTEEANELLVNDGLLDCSAEGRKNVRKRALARKKEKANAEKAAAKKEKSEQAKKAKAEQAKKRTKARLESQQQKKMEKQREKELQREQRELEKRRKKRLREREKMLKEANSNKKRKIASEPVLDSKLAEKRGRATAIVNGYLTRLVKREDLKNLSIAGVFGIPASCVESQGLLGMTLAFRAAAGEFPMPDSGTEFSRYNEWDAIDVNSPKTSEERMKRLRKQVEMIESRIAETKAATQKRKQLTAEAKKQKTKTENEIFDLERKARRAIMSREKHKSKSKKSDASSTPSKGDDDAKVEKVTVVEAIIDGGEEADAEVAESVVVAN